MTSQKRDNSILSKGLWLVVLGITVLYLLNPTGGIVEFLPDNIPIIGNLDEATATALLLKAIQEVR